MNASDQAEVVAFLSRPQTFAESEVHRIETHISIIFLAGGKAYKLKRAVVLPYLDFSSLDGRRRYCEAEIAINRRTAPELYERVAAVTREQTGALALDGLGQPIEYLVVMKRFDQNRLFDHLAEMGELSDEMMSELADAVARFHRSAAPRFDRGGCEGMETVVSMNLESLRRHAGTVFEASKIQDYGDRARGVLKQCCELLDARREAGFVRHCHGDLHLRNICLYNGKPLLFDAIEFSEEIGYIDTFYDLAFLLMDLEHRRLRRFANVVFNRYLAREESLSLAGLAALPLFLSCRAAVRAHVGAEAAAQSGSGNTGIAESQAYLNLALSLLSPPRARLVAIGGLSGTGKSTLAKALAPELGPIPGALILRSDVIRKSLFGIDEGAPLPAAAYGDTVTVKVYEAIAARAAAALKAGHSVIADAVYAKSDERAALETVAMRSGVPFSGFWLEAPVDLLEKRVAARLRGASDATVEIVRRHQEYSIGEMSWRRIDAGHDMSRTLAAVRGALKPF
ncbi:MAG: AAA family ATPase [Alphaproteobacteria bacterium]